MLRYPHKIRVETIKDNYSQGGAVIGEDLCYYVGHTIYGMTARKAVRLRITHRKMSDSYSIEKNTPGRFGGFG